MDEAAIAAINAAQEEEQAGDVTFQTPILKVTQSLTKEVKEGDVDPGEFFNSLTTESYGTKIEFIPAFYQRGRSASAKGGRYYVAIGTDTIPESWAELVGEEFVGTPFAEYPDAEEQYKRRVNAGEIKWESGPLVSTTYNYTGLVVQTLGDADDEETEYAPVRIAFLRSTKKAHDKIQTLKKATMRNKAWWDAVFSFETKEETFGRNTAFTVKVAKVRDTDANEKAIAVQLAQAVIQGRTTDNAEAAEAGSEQVVPSANGGLDV